MSKSASQTPNMARKFNSKSTASTGGINEDFFYDYFGKIKQKEISSSKELQECLTEILNGLKSSGEDWERKVKCLIIFQSIMESGQTFDEFLTSIRQLNLALQNCLSDLRSQVVREACLTVGYLAHTLKAPCEQFIELLMPSLIALIPNSARVMSSSAMVCLNIIITNIPSDKLLKHIVSAMSSKSNSTRRFSGKLLETICGQWNSTILDRQLDNLQSALDRGTSDADQETRAICRRAFVSFAVLFPNSAQTLLVMMDSGRRSLLEKELSNNPAAAAAINFLPASTNGQRIRRTSCPPTSITGSGGVGSNVKMGTVGRRRFPSSAKAGDSEDESSISSRPGFSSLNRPRIKTQVNTNSAKTNNVMSSSTIKSTDNSKSKFRGSNSSLSNYSYRSSARNTPQSSRKNSLTNIPTVTTSNTSSSTITTNGSTYKYKPTGSVSASLPRRKNIRSNSKPNLYPPGGNENGLFGTYNRDNSMSRRKSDNNSDDNASETSSIESSEVSKSSLRAQRPTESVPEIIRQLSSSFWADKKDGLINLQNLLQIGRLSPSEVKKFVEVLNLLFNDAKSKLFPLFLSTVRMLIETHNKYLNDWLFALMMNLLSKQASETITSRQRAIQETLGVIRSQFPLESVLRDCCRALSDSYNSAGMKLKVSVLSFLKTVIIVSPNSVLETSLSSLTPTMNILVEWSLDSKWQEVRKLSSAMIIKMNELHPQILNDVSHCLAPTVRQKLSNLIRFSNGNIADNTGRMKTRETYLNSSNNRNRSRQNSETGQEDINSYIRRNTEDMQALSVAYDTYDNNQRPDFMATVAPSQGLYNKSRLQYPAPYRTQLSDPPGNEIRVATLNNNRSANQFSNNFNDPASYMIGRYQSSMRNAGIENNNCRSNSTDLLDASTGSCSQYYYNQRGPVLPGYGDQLGYSSYYPNYEQSNSNFVGYYPASSAGSLQDSSVYSTSLAGIPGMDIYLQNPASIGYQMLQKLAELPPDDIMISILSELCTVNQRTEQRKVCLMKMACLIRENALSDWTELFKTILMRLLETVKDNDPEIRSLALRAIQELTKLLPDSFDEYIHVTILLVLQSHRDTDKTVVKSAEECGQVLARCLSLKLCVKVLAEMIAESDCRINLGALKMLLQVLKIATDTQLIQSLNEIIPGLIQTSEHDESHIRKASIFCLVEIHRRIGDGIWSYLTNLTSSKARLLRLYIDKNRTCRMSESTTMS